MSHSVIGIARCSLSFVCLGVLFTAVGVGCSGDNEQTADPESSVGKVASLEGGLALFQKHCAACHGDEGRGDGDAAYNLYPKPRDFTREAFRVTSTERGTASDKDLIRTLTLGMPGSAMPSWKHLGALAIDELVLAVRHFAEEGRVFDLMNDKDDPLVREEATEIAQSLLTPGAQVQLPSMPNESEIDLAEAKLLYNDICAKCHDEDGRGRSRRDLVDTSGLPVFSRDFTEGIFKGGADATELAYRIVRGMPGTPMPGTELDGVKLWSLVRYIQGMVPEGAQDRVRQVRQDLAANRVESVPDAPDEAFWGSSAGVFLPVMPLWWRDERIEGVRVRAAHDGQRIALELAWDDATVNDHVLTQNAFTDGVAIQLSMTADPPFFGMGSAGTPVNLWHWKAAWQRDARGGRPELVEVHPNMPRGSDGAYSGIATGDVYQTASAVENPISLKRESAAEDANASRFSTLAAQSHTNQSVRGVGRRTTRGWSVSFVRDLTPGNPEDVALATGAVVPIAFAVWDGAAGDRNGKKAVTIWHRLILVD